MVFVVVVVVVAGGGGGCMCVCFLLFGGVGGWVGEGDGGWEGVLYLF